MGVISILISVNIRSIGYLFIIIFYYDYIYETGQCKISLSTDGATGRNKAVIFLSVREFCGWL